MNIYKFALNMEKTGEEYYLELYKKTDNEGLKKILKMLSDEEVKHHKFLEKMYKNDSNAELAESTIIKDAKSIFVEMKNDKYEFKSSNPQTELYRKAKTMEENSYLFYLEKSQEVNDESQKKILLKLAEEEKKHMFLMDNLVEFISRPETWIENAEFNHFDVY